MRSSEISQEQKVNEYQVRPQTALQRQLLQLHEHDPFGLDLQQIVQDFSFLGGIWTDAAHQPVLYYLVSGVLYQKHPTLL
jgi:hypothetical protein